MGSASSRIKGSGMIYEKTRSICVINFKIEWHYDVRFELFCLSMCLRTLDSNNNKNNHIILTVIL